MDGLGVLIYPYVVKSVAGEWKFVTVTINGSKYYYDKDRVRKSGKYLYFWILTEYIKPNLDLSH